MWGRTVVEEDDSLSGPRGLFGLRIPLLGAFDYRLHLTHESHKSFVIKDLFLKKGTHHLSECANAALPHATVMRACVGLKFYWILLWSRNSEVTPWIHPSIALRRYFSLRTKFPPSSDLICSDFPFLTMKRCMLFMKESMSKLWATSMWIARMWTSRHISWFGFSHDKQKRAQNSQHWHK